MRSSFDILCEKVLTDNLLLEMPVKRVKSPEDYQYAPEHGTYAIEVEASDPEVRKKVVVAAVKNVLADLEQYPDQEFSGSPKDYQDKIAEQIRKAINEVIPGSKQAARGKPYTANDYYAARAIAKALREQGITLETKDATPKTPKEVASIAKDVSETPDVDNKVADAIEDTKPTESTSSPSLNLFNAKTTYDLNQDYSKEDFTSKENSAIEYIESGDSGEKIVKTLKGTLTFRNSPDAIRPFIEKLIDKGVLVGVGEEESEKTGKSPRFREGNDPTSIARELKWEVPTADPYTGA